MRIVWDEPKRLANLQKHGLDFASLTEDWFADAMVAPARLGRLKAVGWQDGRMVVVVFALLGTEAVSVISMRPASAAERRQGS